MQDAGKKQEIVDSSQNAIGALETAASKAPDSSIDGIKQVGVAAGQGNHTSVSLRAVQSLRSIGLSATNNNRPEIAKLTIDSLKSISDHTNDPSVKGAVEATLTELTAASTKPIDRPPRPVATPR